MDKLWHPVIFSEPAKVYNDTLPLKKDEGDDFSFDFFYTDEANVKGNGEKEAELEKKARNSSRKTVSDPTKGMTPVNNNNQMASSTDKPYIDTYSKTDAMVIDTIMQIDELNREIKEDISKIRASSTMKSKYTYLTNLTSASASLIANRLGAIKELNASITQAHNLELKRAKDLKTFEIEKQNDDARMMDMYNAFINAPMGMYDNKLNMPTISNMMVGANDPNANISEVSMSGGVSSSTGPVTPEQMRMRMEGNNNIQEVVFYDPASGRKWFEAIDMATGQPVPNYPTSDPFLLEDVTIESRAGIAKNRNLDRVWPLQMAGNSALIEY